jgi:drug/metabolite transporter (DMT)-like permease
MTRAARNRRGIVAMLIAAGVFSLMDVGLKLLSPHYPAVEVAALRSLASLPLVLAYVGWRCRFRGVLRVRWGLNLLRAALGVAMISRFTLGVRRLPLAEAYSIFFVAPLLITALSAVILKERVEPSRWIAVVVGLAGVLVVLRPTGESVLTLGGLAVLTAATLYAISAMVVRILGRTDSGESLVLWLSVLMSAAALALAAPGWVPVRMEHAWILAGIAVSGFIGQIAITEAFRESDASAVAPFEYTAMAWGVTLDRVLWHVLPDGYTVLGASIIIASGLYLARHEKVHAEAEHP